MTRRPRPISLDSLRGFDAAARHLSFTLAAQEMHLTQSSVSRQVQSLEDELGHPLFLRLTRRLELTPAGHALHRAVQLGIATIDEAVDQIREERRRRMVSVTTFASCASLLIVPKLPSFSALHPEVDIRIDASDEPRHLEADGLDLAVRYTPDDLVARGAANEGRLPEGRLLVRDRVVPLMCPRLLESLGGTASAADLGRLTLLVEEGFPRFDHLRSWDQWFQFAGVRAPRNPRTITFGYTHQCMDAAIGGQGVMLCSAVLAANALRRGHLVAPVDLQMPVPFNYVLHVNARTARNPDCIAFTDWIVALFDDNERPVGSPG